MKAITPIPYEDRRSLGGAVYLRPLREADFTERYLAWFKDEEVTRYLEARDITRDDAIAHLRAGDNGVKWYVYAICEVHGDRHIGNLKVGPIHWGNRVSDLVTVIGERDAWGKGYGREAILIGIDIAFNILNMRKLSASIHARNTGSIKAYTAAGFKEEAVLKDQYMDLTDGAMKLSDMVYVACFNPTFNPKNI